MNISVFSKIPHLIKELRVILPNLNFHEINEDTDANFKQSEIIIGDFDLLAPHIYSLRKLKWMQGTWAGLDAIIPYVNEPLPFLLTRFSGHHFGQMMSEYVITSIVNNERDFYTINKNKKSQNWSLEGKIQNYRVISELTVGIMGIGNIGSWIGRSINLLGAKVLGYGRRPTLEHSQENSYILEYFTKTSLPKFLQNSDYIVNVLPTTPETAGLLNGNILQNCMERNTILINVGRGTVIDENDLIHALNSKWISGAILDVFQLEPLPKESRLWSMEQSFKKKSIHTIPSKMSTLDNLTSNDYKACPLVRSHMVLPHRLGLHISKCLKTAPEHMVDLYKLSAREKSMAELRDFNKRLATQPPIKIKYDIAPLEECWD